MQNENMKWEDVYSKAVLEQRTWLRHYPTSRKVEGSKPDEVNDIFQFN
jgi:hypothetical protein